MRIAWFGLTLVLLSSAWGIPQPALPPPPTDNQNTYNMSIFGEPTTKSGSPLYDGQLRLFPEGNKEHTYTLAPQPIYDVSSNSVQQDPGYKMAQSPNAQNNMSFGLSIPLFGGAETDKSSNQSSNGPKIGGVGANNVR